MRISGELKIIIGAALFAFIPVGVVLGKDLSVYSLLFGRLLVATIFLLFFQKNIRQIFKLNAITFFKLLSWSMLMLLAMITYFLSIGYSNMGVASALLGTQPLFIVLLAGLFLREKISGLTIAATALTLAGIACITGIDQLKSPTFLLGQTLAICSALLLALNFILQKKYLSQFNGKQLVFYQSLAQLPLLIPFLFFETGTVTLNATYAVLLLGIVCTVISYSLIYNGINQVNAQKIGVLQSIEYVIPVFIGMFFFNEKPDVWMFVGMILIIVACLLISLQKNSLH